MRCRKPFSGLAGQKSTPKVGQQKYARERAEALAFAETKRLFVRNESAAISLSTDDSNPVGVTIVKR